MRIKPFTNHSTFLVTIITLFSWFVTQAQERVEFTGKQFFAMQVPNADSTSRWYQDIFGVTLLKEIKPNNQIHIKILGNEYLMIEIGQNSSIAPEEKKSSPLDGIFKVGFYVKDINKAEKYFKEKKVKIRHGIFKDEDTKTVSFIIEDLNGTMLQLLQNL